MLALVIKRQPGSCLALRAPHGFAACFALCWDAVVQRCLPVTAHSAADSPPSVDPDKQKGLFAGVAILALCQGPAANHLSARLCRVTVQLLVLTRRRKALYPVRGDVGLELHRAACCHGGGRKEDQSCVLVLRLAMRTYMEGKPQLGRCWQSRTGEADASCAVLMGGQPVE